MGPSKRAALIDVIIHYLQLTWVQYYTNHLEHEYTFFNNQNYFYKCQVQTVIWFKISQEMILYFYS